MKDLLLAILFSVLTGSTCHKATGSVTNNQTKNCYKARLAIKGICMNYVIEVFDGDLTKLNVEKEWKDETDGKTYTNVFALGSRCTFPDMDEGAEFYFTLSEKNNAGCNVCMGYRPVPPSKNAIVVTQTSCR
jgi:hypothetical protein